MIKQYIQLWQHKWLCLPQSNYPYVKLYQKSCDGILTSTFTIAISSTADRSAE